ncbi:MAG: hypothetical protein H0X29_00155 [Parachlamydiaceae bacterium]|nr:hypothetical protein [Parachlamydiaceae bacterium]
MSLEQSKSAEQFIVFNAASSNSEVEKSITILSPKDLSINLVASTILNEINPLEEISNYAPLCKREISPQFLKIEDQLPENSSKEIEEGLSEDEKLLALLLMEDENALAAGQQEILDSNLELDQAKNELNLAIDKKKLELIKAEVEQENMNYFAKVSSKEDSISAKEDIISMNEDIISMNEDIISSQEDQIAMVNQDVIQKCNNAAKQVIGEIGNINGNAERMFEFNINNRSSIRERSDFQLESRSKKVSLTPLPADDILSRTDSQKTKIVFSEATTLIMFKLSNYQLKSREHGESFKIISNQINTMGTELSHTDIAQKLSSLLNNVLQITERKEKIVPHETIEFLRLIQNLMNEISTDVTANGGNHDPEIHEEIKQYLFLINNLINKIIASMNHKNEDKIITDDKLDISTDSFNNLVKTKKSKPLTIENAVKILKRPGNFNEYILSSILENAKHWDEKMIKAFIMQIQKDIDIKKEDIKKIIKKDDIRMTETANEEKDIFALKKPEKNSRFNYVINKLYKNSL